MIIVCFSRRDRSFLSVCQIVWGLFFRHWWKTHQMQVFTHKHNPLCILVKTSLYMQQLILSIISHWPIKDRNSRRRMVVAAGQPEANSSKVSQLWSTHAADGYGGLSGVWMGAGAYRSTNLLPRGVSELYPDLLLGRRRVLMRSDDGRWQRGR